MTGRCLFEQYIFQVRLRVYCKDECKEALKLKTYTVKITSKGQITIPKDLRDQYNFQEGVQLMLTPTEQGVLMRHPANPLRQLKGLMRREIDLDRAEEFLTTLRKEWRLEDCP